MMVLACSHESNSTRGSNSEIPSQKRRKQESSATTYGVFDREFGFDLHEWSCSNDASSDRVGSGMNGDPPSPLVGNSCVKSYIFSVFITGS